MKDSGILVMGFLFAWDACKGALSTVTVLITVQRKAGSSVSLGSLQLCMQGKSSRSGRAVLGAVCCIPQLHTRIQLWISTVAWLPETTNWQRDFLALARLKFIYPADLARVLVTLPGLLPTLWHSPVGFPPGLSFRLCVCWSSAYFCSSKHF